MKRKLYSIALCLFLILVAKPSFAQEGEMTGEIVIASPSPIITITPTPNYVMVYPGILPDNPLYGIKTLRDKVVSFMIGDPLKKAEFDLLQADKRIGAALLLIETGERDQQELALSTISKGQNYYEDAIHKLAEAKSQGSGSTDMVTLMKRAVEQHIYKMQQSKKKLPKDLQPTMEQLIQRSLRFQSQVKTMK